MHKALYRVYRPKVFEDVIGQDHIIKTLRNQIENNNLGHAYLFSGTRGTGKTSTAKIFARAVNCLNPINYEPCNECDVCMGIFSDSIMDVIEIDAASNNGVDDIRELRENVKYPPSKGKYKVYIIDEVHMLSQGAFNALLKTLEEPPSYIIFILATTESHKLPATILSRCQRFDFKRVKTEDMINRMKRICNDINIEVEEKALNLIARNSGGALRDALSILDQCISYSDKEVKYEDVLSLLGTVNIDFLFEISRYILEENTKQSLELLNELVILGKDIKHFINDLIDHFRNLMICKVSKELDDILPLPGETIELLKEQSSQININDIIRIINTLSETESNIKYSSNPRILIEIAIIKLSQPVLDESSSSILKRIERIENFIKNGVKIQKENINNIKSENKKVEEDIKEDIRIKEEKDPNIKEIEKLWPEVLEYIKKDKNVPIQAMLREASDFKLDGKNLSIVFEDIYKFHRDALSKENTKSYVENTINKVSGQNLRINLVLKSEIVIHNKEEDKGISILEEIFPKDIIEVKNSINDI